MNEINAYSFFLQTREININDMGAYHNALSEISGELQYQVAEMKENGIDAILAEQNRLSNLITEPIGRFFVCAIGMEQSLVGRVQVMDTFSQKDIQRDVADEGQLGGRAAFILTLRALMQDSPQPLIIEELSHREIIEKFDRFVIPKIPRDIGYLTLKGVYSGVFEKYNEWKETIDVRVEELLR